MLLALSSACSPPAHSAEDLTLRGSLVFDALHVSFPELDTGFVEGVYEYAAPGFSERLVLKDGRFHIRMVDEGGKPDLESGAYSISGDTLRLLGRHGIDLEALREQGIDEESLKLLYEFDACVPARVDGQPALWRKLSWQEYSKGNGYRPRDVLHFVGPPTPEDVDSIIVPISQRSHAPASCRRAP